MNLTLNWASAHAPGRGARPGTTVPTPASARTRGAAEAGAEPAALALLAALVLAVVTPARAEAPAPAAVACPERFAGGTEPALVNPKLAARARGLCYRAYAVLHSGATRTPLWSAEHLTRESVESAHGVRRLNLFHPEERLPAGERSELSDYARSGYDRGHMAPSGDMPDAASQAESFSLANMVPQAHRLNTGPWSEIEGAVRDLARRDGELYVVTGPVFQGTNLQVLDGRVAVPTAVFKAVYDPGQGTAGAYLAPNRDNAEWRAVSIAELRELTGIDAFPAVPEAVKAAAPRLPEPPRVHAGRRSPG